MLRSLPTRSGLAYSGIARSPFSSIDTWHDWTIELRLGTVYIMAHWRARAPGSPADWDWCATEAEQALNACVLLGRRVRRGLLVDMPPHTDRPSRTRH